MSNAMEILGDRKIIHKVFIGEPLKIYEEDDQIAAFLKKYINEAIIKAINYHEEYQILYDKLWEEYKLKYNKWNKNGRNGEGPIWPKSHYLDYDLVVLKVNHYRQKFWYWKKLKE